MDLGLKSFSLLLILVAVSPFLSEIKKGLHVQNIYEGCPGFKSKVIFILKFKRVWRVISLVLDSISVMNSSPTHPLDYILILKFLVNLVALVVQFKI